MNTCIEEEDLNRFVNRLHPNLVINIQSYKKEDGCYLFQNIMGVIGEIEMVQENL